MYRKRFAVFPAGNRRDAIRISQQLAGWGTTKFICLADRDFDKEIADWESQGFPIFTYANADLEAMACSTDAFRRVMYEVGSQTKIDGIGGLPALVSKLHEVVEPVSRLRAASHYFGWGLKFDEVELAGKIDKDSLTLKLESYCAALSGTVANDPSQATLIAYATGVETVPFEPKCPHGSYPYFRGRDFLSAAGVALRSRAGTCPKAVAEASHLEGVVRAAAIPDIRETTWAEMLERTLQGTRATAAGGLGVTD
ncbi:hypothetical protein ACPSM1_19255 [Micromonospora chersina]|uniref:hypothetical protein n=1 Tax=Micromonospora chersina TaxID=47854 RepID=UPI003CBA3913